MESSAKVVTLAELAKHNSKEDLWIAVHGRVYGLASFATDHPGGADVLLECAGTDGTETYEYAGHSADAMISLGRFVIGTLEGHADTGFAHAQATETSSNKNSPSSKARIAIIPTLRQLFQRYWAWLLVVGLVVLMQTHLLKLLKGVFAAVSHLELGHPNIFTGFWAGLLVAFLIASVGISFVYTQFAKTLQHTKEPFEYPAVIPRPIRTSG